MIYQDVLEFITLNPVFTIATMEGAQPRVRAALTVLFDDGKIHFTTTTRKAFGRQIRENPNVELCYLTPDFQRMLRITGTLEELDDLAKKQKLVDERDYLKDVDARDETFKLMRLTHGRARFWTLADNMREEELEVIEF